MTYKEHMDVEAGFLRGWLFLVSQQATGRCGPGSRCGQNEQVSKFGRPR